MHERTDKTMTSSANGQGLVADVSNMLELERERLQLEMVDKTSSAVAELVYALIAGFVWGIIIVLMSTALAGLVYYVTDSLVAALILIGVVGMGLCVGFLLTGKRRLRNLIIRSLVHSLANSVNRE